MVITGTSIACSHFQKQKENLESTWKLPDDFVIAYSEVQGEVEVGGVYLRLFIQQPSWVSDPWFPVLARVHNGVLVLVDMALILSCV